MPEPRDSRSYFLIHQFLDGHAANSPGSEASVFLDSSLSYLELAQRSNQLAHCLLRNGVGRGDRVGIFMDKCLEVPVSIYGILKAGAAYVPLDPSAPAERIAEIIADCEIQCLLTSARRFAMLAALADQKLKSLVVIGVGADSAGGHESESWSDIAARYPPTDAGVKVTEDDLAYIIYTSGSTGQPKGIMHTHRSCLSFARWAAREYGLDASDRVSNHAPLHFDLSIFDYFATVVAGGTTVIIPEEYTKLPPSYSQLIADASISVLFTVPFALIQLSLRGVIEQRDLSRLRLVIFGGEPMPPKYLAALMRCLPQTSFDNMYGPAEVNGCNHHTLLRPPAAGEVIPIGPISQIADALILDAANEPVGEGETGELLVRTPAMMAGYWNRPDLNAKAFYRSRESGLEKVWYRTGDLVRMDADGVMYFVGRRDRQAKVRGYRIELDEIELALAAHEAVEEAAVYAVADAEGQAEVRGAIRANGKPGPRPDDIANYLRAHLPWYALPAKLRFLDDFPRTTTGKIDRRALSKEEGE